MSSERFLRSLGSPEERYCKRDIPVSTVTVESSNAYTCNERRLFETATEGRERRRIVKVRDTTSDSCFNRNREPFDEMLLFDFAIAIERLNLLGVASSS